MLNGREINTIKRSEIYYVDFGLGKGSEQGGVRPAIIIQNDVGNYHSPTLQVIPLTSKCKAKLPTHVTVGNESGLRTESIALVEQIRCVDKERLIVDGKLMRLGIVPEYIMDELNLRY